MANNIKLKTALERSQYARKLAVKQLEDYTAESVARCGRENLLSDLEEAILLRLPRSEDMPKEIREQ